MVVRRRKKVTKYRGHVTHGGGSRKKRRGAGSRGGRGNAGTGKRAGHKKAGQQRIFGQQGFVRRRKFSKLKIINVGELNLGRMEKLVAAGKASKEGNLYSLDLDKLGYGKLLGTGEVTLKLKLTVAHFSKQAEEKIKAAGGEIISSRAN